ncbi:hypothetical protein, partial [Bacteroides nordii]|uniref:hypothetical protein n=1 Tax=Bacteroides nordii TaxID=291645 RepID=UPI003AF8178F
RCTCKTKNSGLRIPLPRPEAYPLSEGDRLRYPLHSTSPLSILPSPFFSTLPSLQIPVCFF